MKYLYKYPHAAFPYADLIRASQRGARSGGTYGQQLLDTGVFDDDPLLRRVRGILQARSRDCLNTPENYELA